MLWVFVGKKVFCVLTYKVVVGICYYFRLLYACKHSLSLITHSLTLCMLFINSLWSFRSPESGFLAYVGTSTSCCCSRAGLQFRRCPPLAISPKSEVSFPFSLLIEAIAKQLVVVVAVPSSLLVVTRWMKLEPAQVSVPPLQPQVTYFTREQSWTFVY